MSAKWPPFCLGFNVIGWVVPLAFAGVPSVFSGSGIHGSGWWLQMQGYSPIVGYQCGWCCRDVGRLRLGYHHHGGPRWRGTGRLLLAATTGTDDRNNDDKQEGPAHTRTYDDDEVAGDGCRSKVIVETSKRVVISVILTCKQ